MLQAGEGVTHTTVGLGRAHDVLAAKSLRMRLINRGNLYLSPPFAE